MFSWSVILLMIFFSAFFSGMEIAFVSANKLKIELDKSKGLFSGKIIAHFSEAPSDFIAALLVGNNIAIVIYGIFMATMLRDPIVNILPDSLGSEFSILIIQTIVSTLIILISAEFLPKILFRINPNNVLNFFAIPAAIIYYLLYPVVFVIIFLAEQILRIFFKIKLTNEKKALQPVDLDNYLKEFFPDARNENELEQEIQIFQNAMEFPTVKLRECMIPRTEIIGIEQNSDISELKDTFIEHGLSKILIFSETIDNIIGYVHQFDILKNPHSIKAILRPIDYVPESMLANDLLNFFIEQRKSIAVVVDEFGGTSGILTMEDIIEEIFGEINDEFDVDVLVEKQINENEFIFSGRAEIDYLNEKYHLNLPESEDYETITGLIYHHYQSIPSLNDEIVIENFVITIKQVSGNKIEQVHLKVNP
jgi:putative hemolysin